MTGVGSPVVGIGSFAIKDKRKLSKGYTFSPRGTEGGRGGGEGPGRFPAGEKTNEDAIEEMETSNFPLSKRERKVGNMRLLDEMVIDASSDRPASVYSSLILSSVPFSAG